MQISNMLGLDWLRQNAFVAVFGMAVPTIIFLLFVGYPILYTVYLSFFSWNGADGAKTFIGLQNYTDMWNDSYVWTALKNNFRWLVVTLIFPVVAGYSIAYVLRARLVPFPALVRTVIFFPVTMSLIAVGLMFLLILNPMFGALNVALESLGLGFLIREWFGDHRIAIYTLAFVSGWAFTGMPMIFYFAGLGDVPKETLDAARLEGAGHFRIATRIALPQLRPVTAVVVMLTIFESMRAFDLVAVMTKGAPFGSTTVLGYQVYLESFWNSRVGYGAAISTLILVLSAGLAALVLSRLMKGAFDG
ncbi:sugar ABC transporter permease [Paracoccus caeni]|uniref:Sugar ABC transporter permease n=1 Tax=Paracoccus caeni TaxID=657651 RepID=A0A934SDA9_9RHOB|nr:sugar ABC transporter permease [Paracoccus caeni]MBK4215603.1 sugar ABC transporter permease [Paracoccus caeni]